MIKHNHKIFVSSIVNQKVMFRFKLRFFYFLNGLFFLINIFVMTAKPQRNILVWFIYVQVGFLLSLKCENKSDVSIM